MPALPGRIASSDKKAFSSCLFPLLCLAGLQLPLSGCVTDLLQKYRRTAASAAPGAKASAGGSTQRPGIYPVDQGTFRFAMGYERIWDALMDVLLRNYNLAIADRGNGLITTEWDSYYLDGKVHRNKLSMRLKRLTSGQAELTLFNNVEVLSKLPDGGITEIWLPSDKNKTEIGRILQNMAVALNLPKPNIPLENVAGAQAGNPTKL